MGFRFRKSIKLGGGFRLNLSKGGLGSVAGSKVRVSALARVASEPPYPSPVLVRLM
jgi:hypothetical protein